MSLVPPLKVANLGTVSFTVNSFLLYLRLTVKIFQFLRLSTKFLAVLRLSVNPIETLTYELHWSKNSEITRYFGFRGQDSVKCIFFNAHLAQKHKKHQPMIPY